MVKIIFVSVISYLLGAIPTGYLVGKFLKQVNIQQQGSGNIGTANALKVLGAGPAVLVFAGDLGKALLTMAFAGWMGLSPQAQWWMGLFAVIGHIFPVYLGFKGGKGLAAGLGVILVKDPVTLLYFLLLWVVVYLITKDVPNSSVTGMIGVTVHFALAGIVPGILGALIIIGRHIPDALKYWKQHSETDGTYQ